MLARCSANVVHDRPTSVQLFIIDIIRARIGQVEAIPTDQARLLSAIWGATARHLQGWPPQARSEGSFGITCGSGTLRTRTCQTWAAVGPFWGGPDQK